MLLIYVWVCICDDMNWNNIEEDMHVGGMDFYLLRLILGLIDCAKLLVQHFQ